MNWGDKTMSNTCIFCKIIEREIPAKIEYEDDQVIVFHDIAPKAPLHLLIIPKTHIATMLDVDESQLSLIAHMHKVAQLLYKQFNLDGMRLMNNCNELGGQEVFHVHYHLLGWKATD